MRMSLVAIAQTWGYFGIFPILFAESGLLIGVVLPGDTLLFAAGLLAAKGVFNIYIILIGAFVAGAAGDSVGYWIGKKIGPRLFTRDDSFFFRRSHVLRARKFFKKHGTKTIVIARFVPIVRTFAPVVAGVAEMEYRLFFIYNIIGALLWSASIGLAGYFLGTTIGNIENYILPISAAILVVSFAPMAWEYFEFREKKAKTAKKRT